MLIMWPQLPRCCMSCGQHNTQHTCAHELAVAATGAVATACKQNAHSPGANCVSLQAATQLLTPSYINAM